MTDWAGRSLLRLSLLWWTSLLLLPLLLVQGLMTRRLALRLPEGEPPNEGFVGEGEAEPITLVGLGDSVVAGVGVDHMHESLTAKLGSELSNINNTPCNWVAHGVNGDALNDLLLKLPALKLSSGDIALVSIGVNDVTRLTSLLRWQLGLTSLISELKGNFRKIILLGVPPMGRFTALPHPLRWVLGIRARMLDVVLGQFALMENVYWVDAGLSFDESHLAKDGYHPNAEACELMARSIAEQI